MCSSVFNHDEAMRWGSFIKSVYSAERKVSDAKALLEIELPDWKIIAGISIEPSLFKWHSEEWIGCVMESLTDPSRKGIVYRGTETELEWIDDFEFFLLSYTEPGGVGKVEEGFGRMYRSLKVHLLEEEKSLLMTEYAQNLQAGSLTVAGHSLGGALTVLTAYAAAFCGMETEVYTFGSPMVGDRTFTSAYEKLVPSTWRIYNAPDIVPKLPASELGFTQPEVGIQVNSLDIPGSGRGLAEYHKMDTYLMSISQQKTNDSNQNNEKVG